MNYYKAVAAKWNETLVSIPIALASLLALFASSAAMYSDYMSSYYGYQNLPINHVDEATWMIAGIFQLGQIVFFAMYSHEVEIKGHNFNRWYIIGTVVMFVADYGTDVWFKAYGYGWVSWLISFILSFALYTIGSEFLFVTSLSLLIYTGPAAFKQVGLVFQDLSGNKDENSIRR